MPKRLHVPQPVQGPTVQAGHRDARKHDRPCLGRGGTGGGGECVATRAWLGLGWGWVAGEDVDMGRADVRASPSASAWPSGLG